MGLITWIAGGIKDFLGGMISEFFNWLVEVVVEIADRIGVLLEHILNIFNFVPQTARYFDALARAVFFFLPDICFNIIYTGLAIVGIILIIHFVMKALGKG
ncbi:MAG: hypothetical protein K2I07_05925 [Lachnospiraceae bacterium]|nr:hypothetical protein [Lachnospiraceae bacterium]